MTEVRALRAYAEVALGRQRSPANDSGPFMVPYLRAANVNEGTLDLDDVKDMNFSPAEQHVFALKPGDILVTEGSGSLRAVGASAVWKEELPGPVCFQNTLLRLRPRLGTDPRFLAWWCRYAFADGLFASIAAGANIYHLSAERVRSLSMTYLPPSTQRAVADFLDGETDRVDTLIAAKHRMTDLLAERKSAVVEDAVQRLRVDAPLRRLGLLCREVDERVGTAPAPELLSVSIHHGVIPYATANPDRVPRADDLGQYKVCLAGDIVLNRMRAFQGGVGRAPCRGVVSPDYAVLRPVDPDLSPYLGHLFRSPWFVGEMQARLRGIGSSDQGNVRTPRVNWDDLKGVLVPAPKRPAMDGLEMELARIGRITSTLNAQLTLLLERRQALITSAVTGELDLSGVAA